MNLTENRGVKMTLLGTLAGVVVRVGLCFVPQVPASVADNIMFGIFGMFGANVVSQKVADGMSKGATSMTGKNAVNQIPPSETTPQ